MSIATIFKGAIKMGYQQSYVQYANFDDMKDDLMMYKKREINQDLAEVICLVRVKETIDGIKKGEVLLTIGGERSVQGSLQSLSGGLGLSKATKIHYIDDLLFKITGDYSLNYETHEKYFEEIPDDETEKLLS